MEPELLLEHLTSKCHCTEPRPNLRTGRKAKSLEAAEGRQTQDVVGFSPAFQGRLLIHLALAEKVT